MLGGCRAGARPGAASLRTVLVFQALVQSDWFVNEGISGVQELVWQATAPFRQLHPGIDLRFFGTTVNPVGEVIAGSGPDVVQLQGGGGGVGAWLENGLLLDLTAYVRQSNLNLDIFATRQLDAVQVGGRLYGLPEYTGTDAMVVNLDLVDRLGQPYPSAQWSYLEWAEFVRNTAAVRASKPRLGGSVRLGPVPVGAYLAGWGGAIIDPADRRRCVLDSPQAVACGEFLYPLILEGLAAPGLNQPALFNAGLMASGVVWQGQTLANARMLQGDKWRFYPMPTWPEGAYTFTNENYYAITAGSRQPAAAWELLNWICGEPHYQRAFMHLFLWPPALRALWPEWLAQVHAVAPVLRNKNVEVFGAPLVADRVVAVNGGSFTYQDQQAFAVIGQYSGQILARKLSVTQAFAQAARQVNALEAAGAGGKARAAASAQAFPRQGPPVAAVLPGI